MAEDDSQDEWERSELFEDRQAGVDQRRTYRAAGRRRPPAQGREPCPPLDGRRAPYQQDGERDRPGRPTDEPQGFSPPAETRVQEDRRPERRAEREAEVVADEPRPHGAEEEREDGECRRAADEIRAEARALGRDEDEVRSHRGKRCLDLTERS